MQYGWLLAHSLPYTIFTRIIDNIKHVISTCLSKSQVGPVLAKSLAVTRLNGTVERLPTCVLGGMGSRVQSQAGRVGVRFLYKLGQPPKTFISYPLLSVAQLLGEITSKSFIFISYHRSCYLCRLHIQK